MHWGSTAADDRMKSSGWHIPFRIRRPGNKRRRTIRLNVVQMSPVCLSATHGALPVALGKGVGRYISRCLPKLFVSFRKIIIQLVATFNAASWPSECTYCCEMYGVFLRQKSVFATACHFCCSSRGCSEPEIGELRTQWILPGKCRFTQTRLNSQLIHTVVLNTFYGKRRKKSAGHWLD